MATKKKTTTKKAGSSGGPRAARGRALRKKAEHEKTRQAKIDPKPEKPPTYVPVPMNAIQMRMVLTLLDNIPSRGIRGIIAAAELAQKIEAAERKIPKKEREVPASEIVPAEGGPPQQRIPQVPPRAVGFAKS